MFGTLKGRILIILAVLGLAGFYLYSHGLKLGLDLQGGMHLALEVSDPNHTMTAKTRADATDRALEVIRNRINQFGVEEPIVQKVGSDRILVELAGIRDPARAKKVIEQTAFLQFELVKKGGELLQDLPRIDRAVLASIGTKGVEKAVAGAPAAKQGTPQQTLNLIFGRGDTTGSAKDTGKAPAAKAGAATKGADTAGAQVAATGAADTGAAAQDTSVLQRPFSSLLLESGSEGEYLVAESDVPTVKKYLALPEVQRALPRNTVLRWAARTEGRGASLYRRLYALDEHPFMTGDQLQDAQAGRDPQFNQTIVSFQLDRRGGRTFQRVTSQHIGDLIAIVLDNQVYSAPVVQSEIGARGQIEMGQSPMTEARDLALVLRAGSLPAPVHVVEERTVGPSLGADSVSKGKLAGMVGILVVILIMLGYYHFAGLLAVLALCSYVLVVLGGLAAFNATLTAPGIAGFILSIGMGVDANVLIFERIREELLAGRSVRAAVDAGFQEAMSAIIDTHLTTLITALILYYIGTGAVRGFAVTLSVGIVASFFSSVFVTRTLFLAYMERRRSTEPISI